MVIPEYLGKTILRRAGLSLPRGGLAATPEQAAAAAAEVGGRVVLKAQILAGRRGKSGGIKFAASPEDARRVAAELLGSTIAGRVVDTLLIEERVAVRRELYAAVLNDTASKSPLVLFSTAGGMDIEDVHAASPEKIVRAPVDIRRGLDLPQALRIVSGADTDPGVRQAVATFLVTLYAQYRALDLELLEVNPLVLDDAGALRALDCKAALDDSAKRRHADLVAGVEAAVGPAGTALEQRGRALGLLYIELDGDVGVLANGAGLTLATMDAIAYYGGRPADFLEIGGDAYTKATPGLELVLANPNVRSVLVNFCGAFARTDVMTEGVVQACEALRPRLPMFFSIHGTGEERAQALLRERLGIEPFDFMDDAVKAAIAAARGRSTAEAGRA